MTPDVLEHCTGAPSSRATIFAPYLTESMAEFGIDTPARQAAFLAQIGHESGGLHWTVEIWGPTPQQSKYEPPSNVAAQLGNTQAGDGYRFRGRGLIQTTGRGNYLRTGQALGLNLLTTPDQLAEPGLASRSAACFWASHALNALADVGDFERITQRVNGGKTGYSQRLSLWADAKQALGVVEITGAHA